MANISVTPRNATTYVVDVQAISATQHTVTVTNDYANKLTDGKISTEELIRLSFEFLLEREPNTSILRSFDLPVIARYFPEYERVIRGMMK
jgi:hypothetical protein